MRNSEFPIPEYWDEFVERYPLMRDLSTDIRLLGTKTNLVPFVQFITSQRMGMYSSNIVQAPIPAGAEVPAICTGYERHFADYTFNDTRMEQAATTVAVIPKYRTQIGADPILFNPSMVVVYVGDEDGQVHYKEVSRYTKCADGFGYANRVNDNFIRAGVGIPKGITLTNSPAVQNSKYCLGVNANVCYMSAKETVEDAFCISDELAKRLGTLGIRTLVIDIEKNMVPLNLYSTGDDYKFMPDIHERVRDDGIICGFRTVNESSMISDMTDMALCEPQFSHDDIRFAEPGATVIDIDVYRNFNRQVKTPQNIFAQLEKYIDNGLAFHRTIVQVYENECKKKSRSPSPEFSSLVERAKLILAANRERVKEIRTVPKFSFKGEPIQFTRLVITYKYDNVVSLGNKSSGREGGKGVISEIRKKEHMPVDDYGTVADIIIAPEAVVNRMNLGQLYEQFINFVAGCVMRRWEERQYDDEQQFEDLLGFFADVNEVYADLVARTVNTPKRIKQYMREIRKRGYPILVIPPTLETITPEWVEYMVKKYDVKPTPVEFNQLDSDGNVIRRVRTIRPMWIARKYIYILCKIPHARSCGMTYVNQLGVPVRAKHKKAKSQSPIGMVPIRLGEDEYRLLTMAIGKLSYRILTMYANSPEATNALNEQLLTMDRPTRLDWLDFDEDQLTKSNTMLAVTNQLLTVCGIEIGGDEAMVRRDDPWEARAC